jgi:hypothetical protein
MVKRWTIVWAPMAAPNGWVAWAAVVLALAHGEAARSSVANVALHKPVTGTGYFAGTTGEVFPLDNVVDGRLNDTGTPGDWSFWLTPNLQRGSFTIDLLGLTTVDYFSLQNTHNRHFNDRGTEDFHVDLSIDNSVYTTVVTGRLAFDTTDPIEIVDFDIPDQSARYVRFHVDSYYSPNPSQAGGGLNEIWVWSQVVPEPSSVFSLGGLLGMGLIGYLWRRRRGK